MLKCLYSSGVIGMLSVMWWKENCVLICRGVNFVMN